MEIFKIEGEPRGLLRNSYSIYKCQFSDFSEEEKEEIREATKKLVEGCCSNSANSGEIREEIIKQIDAFTGIIAEVAVKKMFNECYKLSAIRPEFEEAKNQIDILLKNGEKEYTVEVRSSMVKNGIGFALLVGKNGIPYFDIIGPYCQSDYKITFESTKDIYMRVLFDINGYKTPEDIYDGIVFNSLKFYIIAGVFGGDILKANQKKSMVSSEVANPGIYYYLGIDKILDVSQLKENLK